MRVAILWYDNGGIIIMFTFYYRGGWDFVSFRPPMVTLPCRLGGVTPCAHSNKRVGESPTFNMETLELLGCLRVVTNRFGHSGGYQIFSRGVPRASAVRVPDFVSTRLGQLGRRGVLRYALFQ